MKVFLKRLLAGIGIGIGAAIPGVSGGTIAIILNIYESIINAVSNIFKKLKESIIILIPILLGIIGALIPCIILFDKLLDGMMFIMISIFAGLMIGSLPKISNEVKGEKPTKYAVIATIICFLLAISIGICSVFLGDKISLLSHFNNPEIWFYFVMIPVGIIGSFALVIPGISGSMILLILGFYKPLINVASELFKGQSQNPGSVIGLLGCFAIGVVIGFYICSKTMKSLLDKHHISTMYGILGFIVGSIIVLFFNNTIYDYYQKMSTGNGPWMRWYIEVPIGIILMIISIFVSYLLLRYVSKKEIENKKAEN